MASSKPVIRLARREDVSTILALVRELADYEHELASVEATEAKLLETIAFATTPQPFTGSSVPVSAPAADQTSPTRPAQCLLAFTADGAAAGLALYFYNYSTWRARPGIYLEDLYVRPEHRSHGLGRKLLAQLAHMVVEMGGGRLEWSVLKWNKPSIDFYQSIGAQMMSGWVGMRVDGRRLVELARGV